jgi:signal transduction histidine kinase
MSVALARPSAVRAVHRPGVARTITRTLGIVALWTVIAGVFAIQLHVAGLSWEAALTWTLSRWYSWGLVTPGIFWLDRRLAGRASAPARLALHVPLALAWTALVIAIRLVGRAVRGTFPPNLEVHVIDRLAEDIPIYVVIACMSFSRIYAAQVRRATRETEALALRTTQLERQLVAAQLDALRAQVHPHFLFNALNTISARTESNPKAARRLMAQLGDLLRASLSHAAQPLVTVGEELTFLDDYLAIERARFEGRLDVSVQADDRVLSRQVPSFLLQPLVDNAIRHGLGQRVVGGRVEIAVTPSLDALVVAVRDDGVGVPPNWTFARNAGVGLRNIAARLEHLYGRDDLLQVASLPSGGVEVRVKIPARPRTSDAPPVVSTGGPA